MTAGAAIIHVVDDDTSVRTAVARLLRSAGYQVGLYDSASRLLERLPAPERGCVLLDVRMPGLSGPQLQDVLARMGFALPIIFLTGYGDIPTSVRAIKSGAEDFLSKPVSKKILLEAVERALKRYDETHVSRLVFDPDTTRAGSFWPGCTRQPQQTDCARAGNFGTHH